MKHLILALILVLFCSVGVHATDVTIAATTYPVGFSPAGIGVDRSISVTTDGSATVTSSAAFPYQTIGMGGFTVAIDGVEYTVANVTSASSLTLSTAYAGSNGAHTMIFYKYVEIRIYADQAFQPLGDVFIVQPGTPGSSAFFRIYGASIINVSGSNQLRLPQIVLPATTDALINNQARYQIGIYRPGGAFLQYLVCPSSIAGVSLPPATPTSWADLCSFNSPTAIIPTGTDTYPKSIIDARYPSCTSGEMLYFAATGRTQACLTVGSGLTLSGGSLGLSSGVPTSVVNDTNVTGSIASNVLTLGWTGTLAKARQNAATVYNDQANSYSAGAKQSFSPSASTSGLNLGSLSGDPSSPANGDVHYNSATGKGRIYQGGAWANLGGGYNQFYNEGAAVTSRSDINLPQELVASDNTATGRTDIFVKRVPTGIYNFAYDYNGSCAGAVATTGSINSGTASLTVGSASTWRVGQGILVAGAGTAGADLITTVTAISGTTFTLADNASTNVAGVRVQHDDTAALQAAVTAKGVLYLPAGDCITTSSISLPSTTEGFPLAIIGDGVAATHIRHQGLGSAFVGPDGTSEALYFANFSIVTSTPGSIYDTRPTVNRGSGFDFSKTTVVNYPRFKDLRINGWGRWGLFCSNCQGGTITNTVFRNNAQGHLGLVSDQTTNGAKEPNVNSVFSSQFDNMPVVADTDTALTGLAINSGSYVLTSTGTPFTSSHEGRLIRVAGAGIAGGDLIALIKSVDASNQVTLSAQNETGGNLSGLSGTLYKTNYASIYLHHSSGSTFVNNIVQGNALGSTADIAGVRIENSQKTSFLNLWIEDSGGSGGHDIELVNADAIRINGYHSNATGSNSHGGNLKLTNSDNVRVSGMDAQNPVKHFDLDAGSRLTVDDSILSAPENALSSFDLSQDRVVIGDNVTFYTDASTGRSLRGTGTIRDGVYGENWLVNGRLDKGSTGVSDWTDSQPTYHALTNGGAKRYQYYQTFDTQGESDAGETEVLSQVISIPDTTAAGNWTLGFDYYIEDFGGSPVSDRYVKVTVSASHGTGYDNFKILSGNYSSLPADKWERFAATVYLGTGTSRTFTVRILMTRGPNTPIVRLANFRFQPGRHSTWAASQPITDLEGGTIVSSSGLAFRETGGGTDTVSIVPPASVTTPYSITPPAAPPASVTECVKMSTSGDLTTGACTESNTVLNNQANTYTAGSKQSFSPNGTNAGLNLGSVSGDPSSLSDGDTWYDSGQKTIKTRSAGVTQRQVGVIFIQTADQTIASSSSETTLFGSGQGSTTIPADTLLAGKTVRITMSGKLSTKGAAVGNAQIWFYYNSSAFVLTTSTNMPASLSGVGWTLTFTWTIRGVGAAAPTIGQGEFVFSDSNMTTYRMQMTMGSTGNINTAASVTPDVRWTWATADASNSITCTNATVEILN